MASETKPVWTKAQFLAETANGAPLVVYEGRVVNLSGFKHPGGDLLLGNGVVGTDVTLSVKRVHALDVKVLSVIHSRTTAMLDDADALLCQEDKDFRDLSESVIKSRNQPPFDTAYDNYFQLLHPFGAALISLYMFALAFSKIGYIMAVLAHLKLFWWLHDTGHHGFFPSKKNAEIVSEILALIFFGTPMHGAYRSHDVHHAFVNCWDRDWVSLKWLFDIRRPVEDERKKLPLALGLAQAIVFLVGVNAFWFIHTSEAIPETIKTTKYKKSLIVLLLVRHYLFWRFGGWQCYAGPVVAFALAAFISCLNHLHMDKFDHPKDPRRPRSYLRQQVEQTQSMNSGWLWTWVSGSLDYHVEHHMFPNVPSHRLPGLKQDVKKLLAKHNIHYNCVPVLTAIQLTLYQFVNPSRDTVSFSKRNEPTLLQKIQRNFDIYRWGTLVIDFFTTLVFFVTWWNCIVEKVGDYPLMFNVVAMTTLAFFVIIRDGFYMLIFSEFTPAAKLANQPCLRDLWGIFSTTTTIVMIMTLLQLMQLVAVDKVYYRLGSLGLVAFEFMMMHVLQDVSCFHYLHEWMHQNPHMFKWLHAEHHSSRKDMHALHGMRFHPLDLIIENTSGPLIAIAFWWIFGYSEVHVASASFYFLVRGGLLDHSDKLLPLEEEFNYDKGFDRGPVHIIASM